TTTCALSLHDALPIYQQGLDLPGDEGETDRVALGADVGRSKTPVQDRDLAEKLTGAHAGDPLAVPDHGDVALPNDVEPVATGAGLDDRGPRGIALLVDQLAKHRQLFAVETGKQRDPSQRLGGISLDSHRFLTRSRARR